MSTLYLLHKPYRMLSQFTDREGRATLADVISVPGVYAAGRLDYDSEGLLLLSDDGALIHRIAHPRHKQPKTYWVQLEGQLTDDALHGLRSGLMLKDLKLAQDASELAGVDTAFGRAARDAYERFTEIDGPKRDFSAVITAVRDNSLND